MVGLCCFGAPAAGDHRQQPPAASSPAAAPAQPSKAAAAASVASPGQALAPAGSGPAPTAPGLLGPAGGPAAATAGGAAAADGTSAEVNSGKGVKDRLEQVSGINLSTASSSQAGADAEYVLRGPPWLKDLPAQPRSNPSDATDSQGLAQGMRGDGAQAKGGSASINEILRLNLGEVRRRQGGAGGGAACAWGRPHACREAGRMGVGCGGLGAHVHTCSRRAGSAWERWCGHGIRVPPARRLVSVPQVQVPGRPRRAGLCARWPGASRCSAAGPKAGWPKAEVAGAGAGMPTAGHAASRGVHATWGAAQGAITMAAVLGRPCGPRPEAWWRPPWRPAQLAVGPAAWHRSGIWMCPSRPQRLWRGGGIAGHLSTPAQCTPRASRRHGRPNPSPTPLVVVVFAPLSPPALRNAPAPRPPPPPSR